MLHIGERDHCGTFQGMVLIVQSWSPTWSQGGQQDVVSYYFTTLLMCLPDRKEALKKLQPQEGYCNGHKTCWMDVK